VEGKSNKCIKKNKVLHLWHCTHR